MNRVSAAEPAAPRRLPGPRPRAASGLTDGAFEDTSPAAELFVAVDIGASSGRVIVGKIGGGAVELDVVHRFPNGVVELGDVGNGSLRWDLDRLLAEVLTGLKAAADHAAALGGSIGSIGIDAWAVDYGLVDEAGALAGPPFSYRDPRSHAAVVAVHELIGAERMYGTTGLQHLPFNTVYQLATERDLAGRQALLIPDLIAFKLTGVRRTEVTNASTTGLLGAATGTWASDILGALNLPADLFPPLVQPGETIGVILPEIAHQTGLPGSTPVVAVGSHDTASAVAAVPADTRNFAYISSGTWSLVGVELEAPILSEASRLANFTNERGVDGTIRYLRNAGGLWLLSESMRDWAYKSGHASATELSLPALLAAAAAEPAGGPLIDVDSPCFIAPGNMPDRIREAVNATGLALPPRPAAVVRCILDSLAAAYATTVKQAQELSGQAVEVVHVVGGGAQNGLLCQLTANATGLPVIAGPVEATALGNVLIQARAAGAAPRTLAELRKMVADSHPGVSYQPL